MNILTKIIKELICKFKTEIKYVSFLFAILKLIFAILHGGNFILICNTILNHI